jgi:hypothetical protein
MPSTIGSMTAKELVVQEAPTWSEEQAERALRAARLEPEEIVASRVEEQAKPNDPDDDREDMRAMAVESSLGVLRRMDEEEVAEFGETIAEAWGYESPK